MTTLLAILSGLRQKLKPKWLQTDILYHCQQQAFRPVPQKIDFLVEQVGKPVHKRLIDNGATYEFKPIDRKVFSSNG